MNRKTTKTQRLLLITIIFGLVGCAGINVKPPGSFVQSKDSVNIYYSDVGQGETALVFIHGWMCDSSYWQQQVDYFKSKFRVVTLDLAGHGQSGKGRRDYSIGKFADDVTAVIENLQLDKVILVGHSMGGAVALEAANRLSGEVVGVVAVDSFATGFLWPEKERIKEVVAPFKENFREETYKLVVNMFPEDADPALVNEIASDMSSGPEQVGISAFSHLLEWMAEDYQQIHESLSIPFVHINALHKNMPIIRDKIVFVSDVGHFIPQEAPDKFNEALEQAIYLMK